MSDLTMTVECTEGELGELAASLSDTPQAQSIQTIPSPARSPAACRGGELACPQVPSQSAGASGGEAAGEQPPPPEHARQEKKRHYVSPLDQGRNWLQGEPYGWIGRKVRNRTNASIYMVRQVFKNGRVQLERNWMSYVMDVQAVRDRFEPHS